MLLSAPPLLVLVVVVLLLQDSDESSSDDEEEEEEEAAAGAVDAGDTKSDDGGDGDDDATTTGKLSVAQVTSATDELMAQLEETTRRLDAAMGGPDGVAGDAAAAPVDDAAALSHLEKRRALKGTHTRALSPCASTASATFSDCALTSAVDCKLLHSSLSGKARRAATAVHEGFARHSRTIRCCTVRVCGPCCCGYSFTNKTGEHMPAGAKVEQARARLAEARAAAIARSKARQEAVRNTLVAPTHPLLL